jgi:hypothetical protein
MERKIVDFEVVRGAAMRNTEGACAKCRRANRMGGGQIEGMDE